MYLKTIVIFCMFLLACSGDTFSGEIKAIVVPDASFDAQYLEDASGSDTGDIPDGSKEDASDSAIDSTPDAKPICTNPNDVEYNQRCFYLDGSNGQCDQGYGLSSNAKLAAILAANPNAWQGKNYRHQISDNACILTKDNVQSYGMVAHANQPGPFGMGEPIWNGSGCTGVYFTNPKQLTLCESL